MRQKITKADIINNDELTPQEKYRKYLKTSEWKSIRDWILFRDNYTCRCCGRTAEDPKASLSVHHRSYENLFNETEHFDDLITLCKVCHNAVHRAPSNRPRFKFKID